MRSTAILPLVVCFPVVCFAAACGESPPPKAPLKEEAIHPLSETALQDDKNAVGKPRRVPVQVTVEPEPASMPVESSKPEAKSVPGKSGAVLGQADCQRVMDRYLGLEIRKNPQFKGLPPEVIQQAIEQAKEMARAEHGEPPCTGTHAQYTCAMAATSTDAWQRCMK